MYNKDLTKVQAFCAKSHESLYHRPEGQCLTDSTDKNHLPKLEKYNVKDILFLSLMLCVQNIECF
jgi:hypothetical protein